MARWMVCKQAQDKGYSSKMGVCCGIRFSRVRNPAVGEAVVAAGNVGCKFLKTCLVRYRPRGHGVPGWAYMIHRVLYVLKV